MSEEQTPPTEYLTEDECAARLSVTRETLSRWRRDRDLPFVALGKGSRPRVRYVWNDVVAWMQAQQRNVPGQPAKRGPGRPRNVDRYRDGGRGL